MFKILVWLKPDANGNIYFVVDNKNHHKKKNFKVFQLLVKRSLNI